MGVVYLLACLLEPFMPSFSTEVSNLHFLPEQRANGSVKQRFDPPNILSICLLQVLKQLSLPLDLSLSDEKGDVGKAKRPWEVIPAGHRIGTPVPLFKELVYMLFCYSVLPVLF